MSEELFSVKRNKLTSLERDFIDFVRRHALQDDPDLTREIEAARKGKYSAQGMGQLIPFNDVTFGVAQGKKTDQEAPLGVYHTIELAAVAPQPANEPLVVHGSRIVNLNLAHIYNVKTSFFTSELGEGTISSNDQTNELVIRGVIDYLDRLDQGGQMVAQ
jgi:hypothetical protein